MIGNGETADLLRDLEDLEGSECGGCGRRLCGHQALQAVVMGFKTSPRCAACLAGALELPLDRYLDQVVSLIQHRECYRSGWTWADRREGLEASSRPECLIAPPRGSREKAAVDSSGSEVAMEAEWDAGSMGCGDLVLELRLRLARVAPGGVLRLTARDPGAVEDIPAWCRLTGHALVDMNPPEFRIRRKES